MSVDGLTERRTKIINQALAILGDEFDNVGIFVNHYDGEDEGSFFKFRKKGNVFAIKGQIDDWVESEPLADASDDDFPPTHNSGDC